MLALIILGLLLATSLQTTYKISEQFFTNSFSGNDFTPWTLTTSTTPLIKFTTCNNQRLFGGYNVFTGDSTLPTQITRMWLNLIPHYSLTIAAKIYKIDSWPNATLFVVADGSTAGLFSFDSSNPGTSDLCGNPNPIPDSINTNYNDNLVTLNATIAHSASSLTLTFISNLMGSAGSWGIRELNITMEACDESCDSCTNGTACAACNTANGLVLAGAYCICSSALQRRQKIVPCLGAPCVTCAPLTCTGGYYPSSITSYCEPCNLACSACIDPSNSISSCSACAAGFTGNPPGGVVCASCFSGCATCTSAVSYACSACKYQYFHYSPNNSCLTSCPSAYYGVQKTATCYPCTSPCANCVDSGVANFFCLSCASGYYLWNYTCSNVCPISTYAYAGTCYSVCPTTTFSNASSYTCIPCGSNCAQCTTSTSCSKCITSAFLMGGACYSSCPVQYYEDSGSGLCLLCDWSCQTCSGPAFNSCMSCVAGSVLINSICYSSCPANTYSNLCLPCDSSCLTCMGSSANSCLSCSSPYFYHLNFTSCLTSCNKGELSNNYNMTCTVCPSGQVAYYQICTPCHSTCLTCNGISFIQCVTCSNDSQSFSSTCVSKTAEKVIYSPETVSEPMTSTLTALLIAYLTLCLFLEFTLQYKTNLLPMLQIFQILSYTYYLSLPLTENTQKSSLMLYLTNFSWLIKPLFDASTVLPIKFALIGKTGSFFADSLGANLIMLIVVVIHLAAKHLSKRYQLAGVLYKKINPYLIAYTFRLVFLELSLNCILYLYCFEVQSTLGSLSLALLIIDICSIAIALLCWKCETELDGRQTALLYNNEIGRARSQSDYVQSEVQSRIRNSQIVPSAINLCSKLPVPITLLLFIGNCQTQIMCLTVYFALYVAMTAIIPHRRLIYRCTVILGSLALFLNAAACVLVVRGGSSNVVEVVWLVLLMVSLFLTIMQAVVNYRYFCLFFGYFCHRLQKLLNSKPEQSNEESQSNLSVDMHEDEPGKKEKSKKTQGSEKKDSHAGKMQTSHFTSYQHLSHNTTMSQNEVKLDLNL